MYNVSLDGFIIPEIVMLFSDMMLIKSELMVPPEVRFTFSFPYRDKNEIGWLISKKFVGCVDILVRLIFLDFIEALYPNYS